MPAEARILDIGCGAGQTLIASYPGRLSFGLDVDLGALRLGRGWTSSVAFACGRAEALPYRSADFDLVVARVSLPYTDITRSLHEIHRVLKPDGMVWMTLHPLGLRTRQVRWARWRSWLTFAYVLTNGLCLHVLQKQFSFFGRHESFQTEGGMRRALRRAGFHDVKIDRKRHFLFTARA